ncbi:hypothetical protein MUK42_20182 [Musa troglodytarum]|uniref:Uncharacterized protein n=1 Tax=Musa troglodytarum TaxID=320322 RepID=A0A9E7K1W5_9LILI|nr:hypothetical protein MUK42_20182 [Musa troglodytarum]
MTASGKVGGLKRRGIGSGRKLYDRTTIKILVCIFIIVIYIFANHLLLLFHFIFSKCSQV